MNNKAVILGNNYYIALSVMRDLGKYGIHTVAVDYSDHDTYATKSRYCKEKLIAPHYKDDPDAFIEFLIDYAKKQEEKPVLMPCHDSYVEVIDQYLDQIREHYLIPQTEQGIYTKTLDKELLHELAEQHGVLVPETVRTNEDRFYEKIDEKVKYPCIVKPTDSPSFVSTFRRKNFKVYNREELDEALQKSKDANLEVIVQRIIPGFDDHMHTFDCYLNQDAKVTHWTTAQKLRQYPINFGASVYTHQIYFPELYEIGKKFLESIKFKGFVEIEFKKDAETGDFYLIELNVRFTNFNAMLTKVGLNFPYITYRELVGEPLPPFSVKDDTGIVFWYAYEDLLAIRDYIKTKQLSIGEVLRSFIKKKAYAIWDWKDPMPAFSYAWMVGRKILKRLFKR